MTSRGLNVDGHDINSEIISKALAKGVIRQKAPTFHGYDFYIVCVSTHNPSDMMAPQLKALYENVYRISREGKEGALVGIDSTVSKGTSNEVKKMLNHRLHVAHVPHRFYRGEKQEHGVKQMRVLGGCEPCCTQQARLFYNEILGIPVHVVSSIEVAELSKLVENAYRFVEIAFAEELRMICDNLNVSFAELRAAVNTKWNIRILEALDGIGGHCLPKDSQMLLELSKTLSSSTSIVEAAKAVDIRYRQHLASRFATLSE
jgi:UDP-N-acetyl-D-mannosaminuronic acid dehydrogenase